jgi:hypothetical protein
MSPHRLILPLLGLAAPLALAATGDRYTTSQPGLVLRSGPSQHAAALPALAAGAMLEESDRQGEWVEVYQADTRRHAWAHRDHLDSAAGAAAPRKQPRAAFLAFVPELDRYSQRVQAIKGIRPFLMAEERGDGELWLMATPAWLALSVSEQRTGLDTLSHRWNGQPNARFVVVDERRIVRLRHPAP